MLSKINISLDFLNLFLAFSFFSLVVMSIEQYLGAYYPIFHRTSATRRRLLTFAVSLIPTTAMYVISNNNLVISGEVSSTILLVIFPFRHLCLPTSNL